MTASLALGDLAPPPLPRAAPRATMEIAAEMLAALDTLTVAGQQHMMARITDLLGAEARRQWRPIDRLEAPLDGLTREVRRAFPDVAAFKARAAPILVTLSRQAPLSR